MNCPKCAAKNPEGAQLCQSCSPELLNTDNHCGNGCNVLFNDLHVEFVKTEDINDLRWTAE